MATPEDAYFARLDAVCAANNCNDHCLISGVPASGGDEEKDEEVEKEERVRVRACFIPRVAARSQQHLFAIIIHENETG